jgi:peroxiredoxin
MQRELQSRGLAIVGVSTHDSADGIKAFQNDIKQEYKTLVGTSDTETALEVGPGRPVTFIIDREGRIRKKISGSRDRAGFEAEIKPLLEEEPATIAGK